VKKFTIYRSIPSTPVTRAQTRFHSFAWGLIAYNLLVVVWGAFVRASKSGAGCGDNWPHCGADGQFVPTTTHLATWIEWTHRTSTAILGPLLLLLAIWAFCAFAKGNPVRKAAVGVLVFTAIEAWIGRYLVLNKLVVDDASLQRAIWMSLHLANILSLMGCLTLTAWWSGGGARIRWSGQGKLGLMWAACFLSVVALAITGALSALGDTLYPAASLMAGMRQDFASEAALLLRTRPLHPLMATLVSLFVAWTILTTVRMRPTAPIKKMAPVVLALLAGQYFFGWWNLLILAPIWAQLTHLLLANLVWIGLISLGAAALAERAGVLAARSDSAPAGEVQREEEKQKEEEQDEEVREWSNHAPLVS
jgi:heme A synthase